MDDIVQQLDDEINGFDSRVGISTDWIKVGRKVFDISRVIRYEIEHREIKLWFGPSDCCDVKNTEALLNFLEHKFKPRDFTE